MQASLIVALALAVGACSPSAFRQTGVSTTEDAALVSRIKGALLRSPQLGSRIEVDAADGVVTLSGQVATERLAREAAAAARGVTGVRSLKSELRVEPES